MPDKRKRFTPRKDVLQKSGGYIALEDKKTDPVTKTDGELPYKIQSPFALKSPQEILQDNQGEGSKSGLLVDDILDNVKNFGRAKSINGEDNTINPEVPVYYGMQNMGTKEMESLPEEATGNTSVNVLEGIKNTVEKVKHTIVKGLLKDEAFKQYNEGKIQLPLHYDIDNVVLEVLDPEHSQEMIKDKLAKYLGIETDLPGTNFFGGLENIPTEIGNIGRIGYNKLFDGNIPLTQTSNFRSKDDIFSKGLEMGTNVIGNLITLSGVMNGTNAALQFVKNPAIKNAVANMIGFTAQQQPELVSNWLQGKVSTEDYLKETGKSGLMGTLFASNPFNAPGVENIKGSKLASLIYNSIIPPLGPQYDALTDKNFDGKRYVEDVLLNAGLDIITHGRVIRKVARDIETMKPEERNPESIKKIIDEAVSTEPVADEKIGKLKDIKIEKKKFVPKNFKIEGEIEVKSQEELTPGDKVRSPNYKNPGDQLEVVEVRKDNMVKVKDPSGTEGLVGLNGLKKIPVENTPPKDSEQSEKVSSTQVNIPETEKEQFIKFAESIPDKELYKDESDAYNNYGRDTEPHVTVLYGLKNNDPKAVEKVVKEYGDVEIKLGKTSLFENDKYDVLKVDVESPQLHDLNQKLKDNVEFTSDFPDYKPHLTIAYLKKGEGKKYAGKDLFEGKTFKLSELLFSDPDSKKTPISISKGVESETVNSLEQLQTELNTARAEKNPVDLPKYLDAFFENSLDDDPTSSRSKPYDELYKQAREHNYTLSKEIISDALASKNIDFGGLSKLADITQPKVLKAVHEIGRYHYEQLKNLVKEGTVKFGKWAKAMTDELGGKVRKHLEGLWKEVKAYFTGEKSFMGTGLSMGLPPPKDGERRPVTQEKIRLSIIGKLSELVNKYSHQISKERNLNDLDLLEKVRQKVKKEIYGMEEFQLLRTGEREKIFEAVQKFYKNRAREVLNVEENPFIEEYEDKGLQKFHPKYWFRQSIKILKNEGEGGTELAERLNKMTDRERELMGTPSLLYLEYKKLSHDEQIEFNRVRSKMMLEELETPDIKSKEVQRVNKLFNEYYKSVENQALDLDMETFDITTNQKRSFKGREVYEPRILDEVKLKEIYPGKKAKGRSKFNRISEINNKAERVFQYMIDTKQAKYRADAIDKLNKYQAKRTQVAKAGNLEFSRIDNVRLPEEYYLSNPLDRLVKYATKISRRIAHAEQFGLEGDIASTLLDKIKTSGGNEPFARELYNYESNIKDAKQSSWEDAVNVAKSWQAISKFTVFTTFRNSLQGFLGSTTRGNIKAGFLGLTKSFTKDARLNAYQSGALADTIESIVMKEFGAGSDTKLGRFTSNYLKYIGFTGTDRINRVISSAAGEVFYKDMLSRIKRDSILKRRAFREFAKLGLDPEAVSKRGDFTEEELNMIRRKFAGDAQFNIRPSDLPLYWSSPFGKLVTQWKPFGYKMGQLVTENVLKETFVHGNPFPLITALAAYGVAGETVNYIIDSLRSMFGFNPFTDDKDKQSANDRSLLNQISKGNTKKIAKRLIEDYGALGVLSLTVDILRTMGYGKSPFGKVSNVIGAVFGPTISTVTTGLTNIIEPPAELIGDDFDYDFRNHVKGLYQLLVSNTPIASNLRTFGITKAFQDWLFGNKKGKKKKKKK